MMTTIVLYGLAGWLLLSVIGLLFGVAGGRAAKRAEQATPLRYRVPQRYHRAGDA